MYITVEVPCRSTTRELLVKELFSPTNMKRSGKKGYYIRTELSLDEVYIKLESRNQDLIDANITKIRAMYDNKYNMWSYDDKVIFNSSNKELEKIIYRYDISDCIDTCSVILDKFLKHFGRF